jgi:hypothetical protein
MFLKSRSENYYLKYDKVNIQTDKEVSNFCFSWPSGEDYKKRVKSESVNRDSYKPVKS